ncbi:hypothetical protein BAUCODRAFT_27294 [Baudoinia panamericana UAMH 10762]|uniref:Uncharacterized protein n=1 Tax=Baudoinia panamericana (strain UAMH 10762) TaxID=717646 RepID=M2LG47_BAUPA|nr:uncharacterized protein BAUCODRAFT_27294 [Baudoinia panamericana UAMH 10762]EMC92992.1 hypothetical protein BAUCODRAFT_27294 [Baudoinia panamericana UAMH 10762]
MRLIFQQLSYTSCSTRYERRAKLVMGPKKVKKSKATAKTAAAGERSRRATPAPPREPTRRSGRRHGQTQLQPHLQPQRQVAEGNPGDAEEPETAEAQDQPAAAQDEADAILPDAQILAELSETQVCQYQTRVARLTTTLQVHPDPENTTTSRLGYRALLHLTYQPQDGDGESGEQTDQIGYIESWRIDKQTAARRAAKNTWLAELLNTTPDRMPDNSRETGYCLQALYFKKGTLKQKFRNGEFAQALTSNSLIFIGMIFIEPRFGRNRFVDVALASYHTLLTQLPEWYAFEGTIVLVPGQPQGRRGEAWGELEEEQVQAILTRVYQRSGYAVWGKDLKAGDKAITVMGRTVSTLMAVEEDGDKQQ